MPKIVIQEDNQTRGTASSNTDIVFIPGFSSNSDHVGKAPKLYTSIAQFETDFPNPVIFRDACIDTNHPQLADDIKSGSIDRSYVMAKELLSAGLSVYYYVAASYPAEATADTAFSTFYKSLDTIFAADEAAPLVDKNDYTIKYLTTGGYPNFWTITSGEETTAQGCYSAMLTLAYKRGDCIAMIEFPRSDLNDKIVGDTSYFNSLYTANPTYSEYGTVFTPWHNYSLTSSYTGYVDAKQKRKLTVEMPGCFGYLVDLAANIKTGPNWLAMAGINRGAVPGIGDPLLPTGIPSINNYMINTMQATTSDTGAIAINPIAEIKPYGYVVWGNRTLAKITDEGLNAHHFLNIRNMVCDIKKVCYQAAKSLLFEQNSEVLWLNFKAQVAPYLEQLKSGQGISDYKLIMLDTRYDGRTLPKETFACAIKIYPLYAVEEFEITIVLSDTDVSIN